MPSLSPVRAEPTNPIRGTANDVVDALGIGRPEEAVGTPADVVHMAGLPTFKDAFPTPIDAFARLTKGMRNGKMPIPGAPNLPRPPGMPDVLPWPGEAQDATVEGERMAKDETGSQNRFSQRYYQKAPWPFPFP